MSLIVTIGFYVLFVAGLTWVDDLSVCRPVKTGGDLYHGYYARLPGWCEYRNYIYLIIFAPVHIAWSSLVYLVGRKIK
jgi:hypothetical protein